jgi:hypothetical protein
LSDEISDDGFKDIRNPFIAHSRRDFEGIEKDKVI